MAVNGNHLRNPGRMRSDRVIVIGAGMGGLAATATLAARGVAVTLLERAPRPGGKNRCVEVAGRAIDAGPTVLTMRDTLEAVFESAGAAVSDHLVLRPADILARHAWGPDERLDLFADPERSAEAIGDFAGASEARGYRAFCATARRGWRVLEEPFIRAPRPSLPALIRHAGIRGQPDLWRLRPFSSLWGALGAYFRDPRLRQLFGRYATYCGSSPFLAPATLMVVAHVEQEGVWLVEGGMPRVALALEGIAEKAGASIRHGQEATRLEVVGGRVRGVTLASGERLAADAVVVNADAMALASGRLGPDAARGMTAIARGDRSLSAVTWALVARNEGFPLHRHNVFFSRDYPAEFRDLLHHGRLPSDPTVYVCAQDRGTAPGDGPAGEERLLCLVNAPACGDVRPIDPTEFAQCEERTFRNLERCGLRIQRRADATSIATPADFERLYPGTGGALYGTASHGWRASFRRPGVRTSLPGMYLAGGSAHPGPGVPMAALSGLLAAQALLADFASTNRWRPMATRGGTSTH